MIYSCDSWAFSTLSFRLFDFSLIEKKLEKRGENCSCVKWNQRKKRMKKSHRITIQALKSGKVSFKSTSHYAAFPKKTERWRNIEDEKSIELSTLNYDNLIKKVYFKLLILFTPAEASHAQYFPYNFPDNFEECSTELLAHTAAREQCEIENWIQLKLTGGAEAGEWWCWVLMMVRARGERTFLFLFRLSRSIFAVSSTMLKLNISCVTVVLALILIKVCLAN